MVLSVLTRTTTRLVAVWLPACMTLYFSPTLDAAENEVNADYQVKIVRTTHGVPHITADDYGSLGYGEGYAAAEDHLCNICDAVITARGEQSLYFGAGDKNENVIGDVVHRALRLHDKSTEIFSQLPEENQRWIEGYARGFNRYLKDNEVTSWCKGDKFVGQITAVDLLCRMLTATQTLPRAAAMIVGAKPPGQVDGDSTAVPTVSPDLIAADAQQLVTSELGSNGWAIGKDRSANGRGMLLANPHFPWNGTDRFWEKHLTVPGKMDIYGAGLVGIPGVTIGFNENVAWTHTVSNSKRFVIYKLTLVDGDPTSYLYDGQPRKMEGRRVTIPIDSGDGKTINKQQTVWFSHYGPMIVMPGLSWTEQTAYTLRAANLENYYALDQWKEMAIARGMDDLIESHRKWNAMPWVNTIATSRDGRAVYLDNSSVGNLSDEAIEIWQDRMKSDFMTKVVFERSEMMLVDGSDSRFEWQVDPSTKIKGVVPFDKKPRIERSDFVFNSNDSYWLTNPHQPLSGYSPLYGRVGSPRSLRTRMNARMLTDTTPSGPSGDDGRFTVDEIKAALFANQSLAAQMLRDELVAACQGTDTVDLDGKQVDLREACQVIARYNGQLDLDSKGAVLFREWITQYTIEDTQDKGPLFAIPFDPQDPINTPRGLNDKQKAVQRLARASEILDRAGLPLDSSLAEAQFAYRSGVPISIPGGNRHEGVANLMLAGTGDWRGYQVGATRIDGSATLTNKGYPVIHGTSFLLCVSFTDDGPHAEGLLAYSQSGDPTSPHYTDQTQMFAKEQLRPVLFRQDEIANNTLSTKVLTAPR